MKRFVGFVFTSSLIVLFQMTDPVDSSKNVIQFEKMMCKRMPNTIVTDLFCQMKYISRDALKINLWFNVSEPISDLWLHSVFNYRFNTVTYQRFPIDLWEDGCGWLAGTTRSYILDWTFGKILKYSNLNHPCPYEGHVYVKIDNISISNFPIEQLLPSGRYRVDHNITGKNHSDVWIMAHVFGSISDSRIEKFW